MSHSRWLMAFVALVCLLAFVSAGGMIATAQSTTPTPAPTMTTEAPMMTPAVAATGVPTGTTQGPPPAQLSANATVFATGFNNPRGLAFGPDGSLYVAEGGVGGSKSTAGQCAQVASAGPYTGDKNGSRISRVDSSGTRTTFAEGFPSSQTNPELGGLVSGVADLAFIGKDLYALTAGSGCSHGVAGTTNGIFRVGADGTPAQIADLSTYQHQNPTSFTEAEDFEPDGTWYGLRAMGGALYAVEPNHGEMVRVTTDGWVSRVTDISDTQGHSVPTALTYHNGSFYVGNLGVFPASAHSKILRIDMQGNVHYVAGGLTAVLGVAFDTVGKLYALEMSAPITSTTPGPPILPGTGRVVRLGEEEQWEPIATGLTFPTAMVFGPDGALYVSNNGLGLPPNGLGQVVRIDVNKAP